MLEHKTLTCIGCPMGCQLEVRYDKDTLQIEGYSCKIGKDYGESEIRNPSRILTTSVSVISEHEKTLPVKTDSIIPKAKIFDCMHALKGITIIPPVHIGDVILENIGDTGANIIATKNVLN